MCKHTEINLKNVTTCKLFEELKNREGVELKWAEPETERKITVSGPTPILIIQDQAIREQRCILSNLDNTDPGEGRKECEKDEKIRRAN